MFEEFKINITEIEKNIKLAEKSIYPNDYDCTVLVGGYRQRSLDSVHSKIINHVMTKTVSHVIKNNVI